MKQIMALAFITVWLSIPTYGQVNINPILLEGEVVAYIKSNIIVPPKSHNGEILLARAKRAGSSKIEYIWLLNEFFGNESNLPTNLYGIEERWKFKVTRRIDCDSILRPDYSKFFESTKTENDDQSNGEFIMDAPPEINFIVSEHSLNIPADKVLPCYQILSLKQR